MKNIKKYKNISYKINHSELFLRSLRVEDTSEKYLGWMNNNEIVKFTEQKYIKYNFQDIKDYVYEKQSSEFDLLFGIFHNSDHIGNIKLGPINFNHKISEISFFIGEKNT